MLVTVEIPDGTDLDGAVVELHVGLDGQVTADVRIPGRRETAPSYGPSFASSI